MILLVFTDLMTDVTMMFYWAFNYALIITTVIMTCLCYYSRAQAAFKIL